MKTNRREDVPRSIHATLTRYMGGDYKSKLEATWAAFFVLVEWSAEYEPVRFAGWVPDFGLREAPTLIEVKPITEVTSAVVLRGVQAKMWRNSQGYDFDLLLLGDGPRRLLNSASDGAFGMFAKCTDGAPTWEIAILSRYEPHGGSLGFEVGGEDTCCHGTPVSWDEMRDLWTQARTNVERSVRAAKKAAELEYVVAPEVLSPVAESGTLAARMRCKLCERRYIDHPHVQYNDNRGHTGRSHGERWALCDGMVHTRGVSKKVATDFFHKPEWWREVERVRKAMGCWAGEDCVAQHPGTCKCCRGTYRREN